MLRVIAPFLTFFAFSTIAESGIQGIEQAGGEPVLPTVASGFIDAPKLITFFLDICDKGPIDTAFTIRNASVDDLIITALDFSQDTSYSFINPPTLPLVIPRGGSRVLQVRFAPTTPGDKLGLLTIRSNAINEPVHTIDLTGRKEAAQLRALSLYFGGLNPSQFPSIHPMKVQNIGTVEISISQATFGNSPPFAIVSGIPAVLAPNAETDIMISFFDPGADGYYSDSLTIEHAPTCGPLRLLVAGTRMSVPHIAGPSSLDFGAQFCTLAARDSSITITNTGLVDLVIATITLSGDPDFSLLSPVPRTIGPSKTDTLTVRFAPRGPGYKASQMTIESNAANAPSFIVMLSGIADNVPLAPLPLDFGDVNPQSLPLTRTIDIENTALVPIEIDAATLRYPAPFAVVSGVPQTIQPGLTGRIGIRFSDTGIDGPYSDTVTIVHRPRCVPLKVPVSARRASFPLIVCADVVDFGTRICAGAPVDTAFVIRNSGGAALYISDMTIASGSDISFAAPPPIPLSIPPGAADSVRLRFDPTRTGTQGTTLTITSTANNFPTRTVILRGTLETIEVAVDSIDFGLVTPGQFPVTRATTLRNIGSTDVSVTAITPPNGSPFTLVSALPIAVPAGGSAPVSIRFDDPGVPAPVASSIAVETLPTCGDAVFLVRGGRLELPGIQAPVSLDLGRIICPGDSTTARFTVVNSGYQDLIITNIGVEGDQDFTCEAAAFPIVIPPGGSREFTVRFLPALTGAKLADLVITNNTPDKPVLRIALAGYMDVFAPTGLAPDFGLVYASDLPLVKTFPVSNDGTVAFTITQALLPPGSPFTITGGVPATLQPGDTAFITVRLDYPGTDGVRADTALLSTSPSCGPVAIPLTAEIQSLSATLRIGSARAAAGQIVSIPVYLTDAANLATAGIRGFSATLRYNRTLLDPLFPVQSSTQGGERVIIFDLPETAGPDSVLATLEFRVALGDDTTTALILENTRAVGAPVRITEIPGRFTLDRVCRQGGTRLIDASGAIALRQNRPNPFNPVTEIEYEVIESAQTVLSVIDAAGRRVATLVDGVVDAGRYTVSFDGSRLPSGVYTCILQTPTQLRSRTMLLVK